MQKRLLLVLLLVISGIFIIAKISQAGFGISPPYVKTNKPIFPGSHYEQVITLLRSSAEEDLQASITVEAPDVASWITLKDGETFDLPKGKLQVPMVVVVDVPEDADVGEYHGYINIRITSKGSQGAGVAVALGARVDIELSVTDETYLEFEVRKVEIPTIETLGKPWNWKIFSKLYSWFFYRVKVVMTIMNTGNAKVAPSRVKLDIFDLNEKNLLETSEDTSIDEVEPFATDNVTASFPTKLPVGYYWGKVTIYQDNEIVFNNRLTFQIARQGQSKDGYDLGKGPWILLAAHIFAVLLILLVLIKIKIWKHLGRILYIASWPLRYIGKKLIELIKHLNIKFWRWLHAKSAKYQDQKQTAKDQSEDED